MPAALYLVAFTITLREDDRSSVALAFGGGGRESLRNDVQILVDVVELRREFAINVVVPLANALLLGVNRSVGAQPRLHQAFMAAIMPHLIHNPL